MIQVTFISDSGHGWYRISLGEFHTAQVEDYISSYSYVDKTYIYLEEDCDFGVFHVACDRMGIGIKWMPDVFHKGESPIRLKERFK